MQLSAFLRQQADLAHDGKIPQETRDEIRFVESAERAMEGVLGPIETTRATLRQASQDVADRSAELSVLQRVAPDLNPGTDSSFAIRHACTEAIAATEWLDDCSLKFRNALRELLANEEQGGQSR